MCHEMKFLWCHNSHKKLSFWQVKNSLHWKVWEKKLKKNMVKNNIKNAVDTITSKYSKDCFEVYNTS